MSGYETDASEGYFGLLGGGMAVVQVVAFTAVGALALDSIVYGAIAGLCSGVGTYLFVPWFLALQADHSESIEEMGFAEAVSRTEGDTRMAVFGFGLDVGSVMMLTAGFSLPDADPLFGAGVVLAVVLAVHLAGSVVLDW
jgi:hypothetical protein